MNMKNKLCMSAGAIAILASMSVPVFASDGNIIIKGEIVGTTCTVKGAAGNGDITVNLDKVSVGNLATANSTAGFKGFSLSLTGCNITASNTSVVAKAGFEAGPNTDLASGRLNLEVGAATAKNVQLQLRNMDNTIIKIGDVSTPAGLTLNSTTTAGTLNYMVGYYATGIATAGTANSSLTYTIVYQ